MVALVELKARRLLPGRTEVDLDDELALWEERDLLLARLLECKTFKDVSRVFGVLADDALNGSSLRRTARTFATGALAAADYKLNFRPVPWTGGTVKDLHERNARRLADLLVANGGLYLKMGQAIAVQGAALPAEFQRMFARMFDDADADAFADVEAVVREDFGGRSVAQVFGPAFERTPRASAWRMPRPR